MGGEGAGRGLWWVLFLLLIGLHVVPLVVLMSSVCVAMPTGYSTCYLRDGDVPKPVIGWFDMAPPQMYSRFLLGILSMCLRPLLPALPSNPRYVTSIV